MINREHRELQKELKKQLGDNYVPKNTPLHHRLFGECGCELCVRRKFEADKIITDAFFALLFLILTLVLWYFLK